MSKKRPNIIIFNPDQWRGDVLGHLGNEGAITPNLDKIVHEDAISFRYAFCQNPVCTPSRCSFMTGWYPHTRGHRTMYYMLHPEHGEPNLLKILKDNGYYVWWGGKNDLVPGQDGPYKHAHKYHSGINQYRKHLKNIISQEKLVKRDWRGPPDGDNYYSFYVGKLETEEGMKFFSKDDAQVYGAADLIKNYKKKKPFCIYLPLSFPHPQYQVEEPFYSMIDPEKVPERTPSPDNWDDKPIMLKGIAEKQNLQGWTEERWKELRRTYYGMCSKVDYQFGVIVDALKQANLYDDTAIFFFSDHGDFTGDYGIVEKNQNTFEDCLSRVPLIVKPPKDIPIKPRVSNALAELVDFSATVYELTGIDPQYTSFGRSLIPLFDNDSEESEKIFRDAAYCEGGRLMGEEQAMERESKSSLNPKGLYYPRISLQNSDDAPYHGKAAMCRTHEYKYVRRLYEKDEFYDLTKDPQELKNQIENPEYSDKVIELKEEMLKWYMETADFVLMKPDKRGFLPNLKDFIIHKILHL